MGHGVGRKSASAFRRFLIRAATIVACEDGRVHLTAECAVRFSALRLKAAGQPPTPLGACGFGVFKVRRHFARRTLGRSG